MTMTIYDYFFKKAVLAGSPLGSEKDTKNRLCSIFFGEFEYRKFMKIPGINADVAAWCF